MPSVHPPLFPAYPPSTEYAALPSPASTKHPHRVEASASFAPAANGNNASAATGEDTGTATGASRRQVSEAFPDWEAGRQLSQWEEKVRADLEGWRGGHGKPRSSVPTSSVPSPSYFSQPVTGVLGVHLPKEIVRVERDWSGGEAAQFSPTFPLELEARLSPADFARFVDDVNAPLRSAYSTRAAVVDNAVALATMWTSLWWRTSWFEQELRRAEAVIQRWNETKLNAVGLNALSPRAVALQYLEIEYY
ncbi:hypothetical protein Q5752_000583 [Cryptotrichosporon argae]